MLVQQVSDPLIGVVRGAPHHADHLVPLVEQQLGEIGAVLPRDAGDDGSLAGLSSLCGLFRFRPLCGALRTHCRIELWLECVRFVAKVPSRDITSATRTTRPRAAGIPTSSAFGSWQTASCAGFANAPTTTNSNTPPLHRHDQLLTNK